MKKAILMALMSLAGLLLVVTAPAAWQDSSRDAAAAPRSRPDRADGKAPSAAARPPGLTSGNVTSVGKDRFEVEKEDGTPATVIVSRDTRLRDKEQTLQLRDLKPGDRVFFRGHVDDNQKLVADIVARVAPDDVERLQGHQAVGVVSAIETSRLRMRVSGGERIVLVSPQTTYVRDGKPASLQDLKVGDKVSAAGADKDGQFVASRIMIATGQRTRSPEPKRDESY